MQKISKFVYSGLKLIGYSEKVFSESTTDYEIIWDISYYEYDQIVLSVDGDSNGRITQKSHRSPTNVKGGDWDSYYGYNEGNKLTLSGENGYNEGIFEKYYLYTDNDYSISFSGDLRRRSIYESDKNTYFPIKIEKAASDLEGYSYLEKYLGSAD